jgi:hypothetical protein
MTCHLRMTMRVFLIGCFGVISCKTRNSSMLATTYTPSASPAQDIGGEFNDYFPSGPESFLFNSTKDGSILINFSYSPGSNPPVAPMISIAEASSPGSTIVQGSLYPNPWAPMYHSGVASFQGKKGDRYVVFVTDGGLPSMASISVASSYEIQPSLTASSTVFDVGPKPKDPSIVGSQMVVGGKAIINLASSAKMGFILDLSLNWVSPKPKLFNSMQPMPWSITLIDDSKKTTTKADCYGSTCSFKVPYLLNPKKYQLEMSANEIADGDLITWSGSYVVPTSAAGTQIANVPGGMIRTAFEQQTNATRIYDGQRDIGMVISADSVQEGLVQLSANIQRFQNASTDPLPSQIAVKVLNPNAQKTLFSGAMSPPDGDVKPSADHIGQIIANFEKGDHLLTFGSKDMRADDIFYVSSTASVSEVRLPSGGIPASNFKDLAALGNPPMDYSKDQSVSTQPYTPELVPVDLAQRSIIDAMETIRNKYHQVIPTGIKRKRSNAIDPRTIQACLANSSPNWSDIMMHFYCQLGRARACYSSALRAGKTRVEAFNNCKDNPGFKAEVISNGLAEVFQYVMLSQTYAFNDDQQQQVINAFYHIDKPDDPGQCSLRPRRGIDPNDGTACLSSYGAASIKKVLQQPLVSINK